MNCPDCNTKMTVSRSFFRGTTRWRERRCPDALCGCVIRTAERKEFTSTVYRAALADYRREHWHQAPLLFPPPQSR